MKLTYFGHSCFLVETSGHKLLFDPFITPNELAGAVDFDSIEADTILISHGHFDHLADAESLAKKTGAQIISNWEIVAWFGARGISNAVPMNLGGGADFDFGRVKYTPAIHSSGLPDGGYGGNPGGFVVRAPEATFYYSGDTALTLDMKLVAEEFDLRFAVLPIGDHFTMGAADAAKAAGFLDCDEVVGVHYDTFPPIRIDHARAVETFAAEGKKLHLPPIGGSVEF